MKPFYLFAGLAYYPKGGFADFHGCFKTVEEAVAIYQSKEKEDGK